MSLVNIFRKPVLSISFSKAGQKCFQFKDILNSASSMSHFCSCSDINNSYRGKNKSFLLPSSKNLFQERNYAMRQKLTEYGIVWKRPEKVPSWKPEKSDDLIPFDEPDQNLPVLKMWDLSDKIEKCDDRVKTLLSLKYGHAYETLRVAMHLMTRKIQRHQFDTKSDEVKIARLTVYIRHLQHFLLSQQKLNKFIRKRVSLQEAIDQRKKKLKLMRKSDYKRFEWLLEELGIIYRPHPVNKYMWITRKDSLRKLVKMHCDEVVQKKLDTYMSDLETQKVPFLKEKEETLKWIADTETKLGLPVSVTLPVEASEIECDEQFNKS